MNADEPNRGAALPPAGWYADPAGSGGQRYWDGAHWTEHRAGPPQSAPAPAPAAYVPRVSPKSPGLATVLGLFLPGVGHLYSDYNGGGAIALLVLTIIAYLCLITIILIPLAFVIWLPCAIYAAIDSPKKAREWNVAHGFPAG
jgi:hypothetical protein